MVISFLNALAAHNTHLLFGAEKTKREFCTVSSILNIYRETTKGRMHKWLKEPFLSMIQTNGKLNFWPNPSQYSDPFNSFGIFVATIFNVVALNFLLKWTANSNHRDWFLAHSTNVCHLFQTAAFEVTVGAIRTFRGPFLHFLKTMHLTIWFSTPGLPRSQGLVFCPSEVVYSACESDQVRWWHSWCPTIT